MFLTNRHRLRSLTTKSGRSVISLLRRHFPVRYTFTFKDVNIPPATNSIPITHRIHRSRNPSIPLKEVIIMRNLVRKGDDIDPKIYAEKHNVSLSSIYYAVRGDTFTAANKKSPPIPQWRKRKEKVTA